MNPAVIRIGIISDTHGVLREDVKEILRTCSYIIHAGDMDQSWVISELTAIGKLYVVRGNNDGEWAEAYPKVRTFSIGGVGFFLVHNKRDLPKMLPKENIILFGHSHQFYCEEKEGKLWLNPGSCGRKRFYGELTMAVMTIQDGKYEVEKIVLESSKQGNKSLSSEENTISISAIEKILSRMQKGKKIKTIAKELQLQEELVETVCRIAVTHPGVRAEGIYNKMEVNHIGNHFSVKR